MRIGVFGRPGAGWLADVVHGAERHKRRDSTPSGPTRLRPRRSDLARSERFGAGHRARDGGDPHLHSTSPGTRRSSPHRPGRLRWTSHARHRLVAPARGREPVGLPFERPVERMRQYLAALLPLLRGESPELHGDLVTSTGALETGGVAAPPVLLGALGPEMLRLAGTVTEGTITAGTGPVTLASHIVPTITAAADAAGRPPPRIVACFSMAITDDRERGDRMKVQGLEHFQSFPSFRAMVASREGASGPVDLSIIGGEEEANASRAPDRGCRGDGPRPVRRLRRGRGAWSEPGRSSRQSPDPGQGDR